MEQNFEIIRQSYFNCYKSFIDCLALTNNENDMYNILILRKIVNNMAMVSIIIRSSYYNTDMSNEFSNNIILTPSEAKKLINDIRDDFNNNHYIQYSSVNHRTGIETLQNTKFSLNIKLLNAEEIEEAMEYNDAINKSEKRHLVLTRN